MHPWTIPILGVVALSLAVPSGAEARLRFGPGVVLGVVAGAMFGGFRHSFRHHHRRHAGHAPSRPRRVARLDRRPAVSAPGAPTNAPSLHSASVERTAAMFWPDAAADLADYVLFANGNDRFWSHGYDTIVNAAFAPSPTEKQRAVRVRPPATRLSDAASAMTPAASADPCGAISASGEADVLIERIERAAEPNASQRDAREQLRQALAQAIERVKSSCPAAIPTTVAERLKAIQDRIWAMHDALLTIRLPFETFYSSLTDEQRQRLRREELESAGLAAGASEGHGQTVADRRAPTCSESAAGTADSILRAIARAARPSEQQRGGLEALRQRSAAMAQLIAGSCPSDAQLDPMARFAAAKDRLDVMLFVVMSMSPVLQQFYDSLDDKQKAELARPLRQASRSGATRRVVSQTPVGTQRAAADVCTSHSEFTDWPIERITEVVQPTDAQRALLDELRVANAKAIGILQGACPNDLPSIPTGRLAAMENRLQVMLAAVQTVRPALDHLYQSLSDEQKARFNAVAPASEAAAGQDQRNLTTLCDQRTPGVTDLPIDRIAQAVRPTSAQQASLDELKDASLKAAEGLKANCPSYQALTPTGRVEAMEKRLEATLGAVKTVQPALTKFYNALSDEQKARFNLLRWVPRPLG